ncbi:hypothetical protein BGX21_008062 [Mortierella sp. AD011]|nr:hypothetical protein BGX20_001775 [Mortierella sp. AD010]KAF9398207.1 hypothetical protein BGX21_008062 [Mortierella sp. AD011]
MISTAHAQTGVSPQPVQEYAFARAGSKLYIQGGHFVQNGTPTIVTGQLFSLDLSINWSVDSPPWKALASGAQQWFFYAVATPDNKTIITIKRTDTESYIEIIPSATESRNGMRPVIDPATSLVYMNGMQYLNIYNPTTSIVNLQLIPMNIFPTRQYAGAVYNLARNSVMYFGGSNAAYQLVPTATFITEYSLTSMSWGVFPGTGIPPDARPDCCMASSEDGNTVVVYGGGAAAPVNFTGSIYILDIPSGKWTRGPDGEVVVYVGCIIVGTQFLAWGGGNSDNTYTGPPVVFDLEKLTWVKNYTAPAYYQNLPTGSNSNISKSSSHLPGIAGGVVGGLFVAALVAFFIYRKRKQDKIIHGIPSERQQQPPSSSQDKNQNSDHEEISTPVTQHQEPEKAQARNPHMAGYGGNLARYPQIAGFNDNLGRSPQDISMVDFSQYASQQQGGSVNGIPAPFTRASALPETDSYQTTMASPGLVTPPRQEATTPVMGYVPREPEYTLNAMNVPVNYVAPSPQASYSKDEYGNVYQVAPVATVSNSNMYPIPPAATKPLSNAGATGYLRQEERQEDTQRPM